MQTMTGVKLNTTETLDELIKAAKKRTVALEVVTPNVRSGFLKLGVKPNSMYSLLDIDFFTDGFNHDLSEQGQVVIEAALRERLSDSLTSKALTKLVVSKTYITTPAPKSSESIILGLILELLGNPDNLQPISDEFGLAEIFNRKS